MAPSRSPLPGCDATHRPLLPIQSPAIHLLGAGRGCAAPGRKPLGLPGLRASSHGPCRDARRPNTPSNQMRWHQARALLVRVGWAHHGQVGLAACSQGVPTIPATDRAMPHGQVGAAATRQTVRACSPIRDEILGGAPCRRSSDTSRVRVTTRLAGPWPVRRRVWADESNSEKPGGLFQRHASGPQDRTTKQDQGPTFLQSDALPRPSPGNETRRSATGAWN